MLTLQDALLRHYIGLDNRLRIAEAQANAQDYKYPPYNIEQTNEDSYVLSIAVAGFDKTEIELSLLNSVLTITGTKPKNTEKQTYLHRGLSFRDFTRTFTLAEHMQVVNAELDAGMLTIYLQRIVPESAKPKLIPIGTAPKIQASVPKIEKLEKQAA